MGRGDGSIYKNAFSSTWLIDTPTQMEIAESLAYRVAFQLQKFRGAQTGSNSIANRLATL
jgi:hypothetical protein